MKIKWELNWVRHFGLVAVAIFLGLPLAGRAASTVVYVNQGNLNATQDGTTWATAYSDLNSALFDSRARGATASNPTEIWIAAGSYKPTYLNFGGTDPREATFIMFSHYRLYGGFLGTETSKTQRGKIEDAASLTVLSGDIGVPESVAATGSMSFSGLADLSYDAEDVGTLDNSYNVLYADGATDVVLDNLVIFGGVADTDENSLPPTMIEPMSQVQAISDDGSNPNEDYYPFLGGATRLAMDNRAAGGGVFFMDAPGWDLNEFPDTVTTNLWINSCVFVANYTEGYGGAVAVKEAKVQVDNSYFLQNTAAYEGGAYWGLNQLVNFYQCNFSGNGAVRSGGAVHLEMLPSLRTLASGIDDADFTRIYGIFKSQAISTLQHFQGEINSGLDLAEAVSEGQSSDSGSSDGFDRSVSSITSDLEGVAQFVALYFTKQGVGFDLADFVGTDLAAGVTYYGYVSLALSVVDLAFNALNLIPGLAENASFQQALAGWDTFYTGFTLYATPGGWLSLLENAISPPPTADQAATALKKAELAYMYNSMPESTIFFCSFEGNNCVGTGGALLANYDPVRVESSLFQGNSGDANAGAAAFLDYCRPNLVSDAFVENESRADSGHSAVVNAYRVDAVYLNCSFITNKSGGDFGFAMDNETGADVLVGNCIFWGNEQSFVFGNSDGEEQSYPTNHVHTGADINTFTQSMLDSDAQASYNSAGNAHYQWVARCDIRYSCVQGLFSMPSGNDIFTDGGGNFNSLDNQGILESGGYVNVGEGNRAGTLHAASFGNSYADPLIESDILTPGPGSPTIGSGNSLLLNTVHYSVTGQDLFGNSRESTNGIDRGAVTYSGLAFAPITTAVQDVLNPFDLNRSGPDGATGFSGAGAATGGSVAPTYSATPAHSLYIDASVAPGGNGSGNSWVNAMTNIPQSNLASLLPSGGVIWIARGTYHVGGGPIVLPAGVSVYGGGSGGQFGEFTLDELNPSSNPTIITAGAGSSNLITGGAAASPIFISGLIFAGATSADGALKLTCPAVVENCKFTNNVGPAFGTAAAFVLTNCQFRANSAGTGSRATALLNAPGTIVNCSFNSDRGIDVLATTNLIIANSQFTNHAVPFPGDCVLQATGALTVTGCAFSGNSGAGAVVNGNGYLASFVNSQFFNNHSVFAGDELVNGLGTVELSGCLFTNNTLPGVGYFSADNSSSINITNCQFFGNACELGAESLISISGAGVVGGCAFSYNIGTIFTKSGAGESSLVNDTFIANSSIQGQAGLLNVLNGEIVQGCNFTNNVGPVLVATNSSVSGCNFVQNSGSPFSALIISRGIVSSCLFSNNSVNAVGAFAPVGTSVEFSGCRFLRQRSGAALWSFADLLEVVNCRFDQNTSPGYVGALYQDGGTVATIVGSEFFQNSGVSGAGAVYVVGAKLNVENCTIVSNTITGSGSPGGAGIRCNSLAGGLLVNSILYGNTLASPAGVALEYQQFQAGSVVNSQFVTPSAGVFPLAYSLIQGLTLLADPVTSSCFDFPPDFVNTAAGNLGLMADSPAIDVGVTNYNGLMATLQATDLAGNPRLAGVAPDLGAYEFQGTPDPRVGVAVTLSQTCSDSVPTFRLTAATTATDFQWQINRYDGNGYVPVTTDGIHSGIKTTNLSVLNPPVTMAGDLYRIISTGSPVYVSSGVSLPAYNSRVYVNANATGDGLGTSWANAFTSLPAAVQSLTNCGQIWVAAGTYPVSQTMAPGESVQILGGFAGTENSLGQRHWQANPTVIQGTGVTPIGFNIYNAVDSGTIIDGFQFSVRGASAVGISAGTPTIQNCVFLGGNVGAVVIGTLGGSTFNNCQFSQYGDSAVANEGTSVFQSCLFVNNTNAASVSPFRNTFGTARIYDTLFTNNVGTGAGGIYIDSGTVTVSRCRFVNNTGNGAGAIWNSDKLFIDNSLFVRNFGFEGAIGNYGSTLQMAYCTVADNVGQEYSGGLYLSSSSANAYWYPNQSGVAVQDCVFWGNSTYYTDASTAIQEKAQIYAVASIAQSSISFDVYNCLVQGCGVNGGNEAYPFALNGNPLFANPVAEDYRLTTNSPALNRAFTDLAAGPFPYNPAVYQSSYLLANAYSYDANNLPRPYPGTLADLGAYEFQGVGGTPVTLDDLPASQTACASEPIATFFISGSATNTYNWQQLVGASYVDVATVPQLQVTQFSGPALTNVLTVPTTAQFNGAVFRVSVNNGQYFTPGATLTIAQPDIIYVNATAAPSGNGSSWVTAYQSLSQAIASAGGCSQVWVAAGTYPIGDPRQMYLRSTVGIYGGFSGTETNLAQRNFTTNVTRVVPGGGFDHFVAESDLYAPADASAILDGLDLSGVWMYFYDASPTVRNCIIENNTNAALYAWNSSSLTISNCIFRTNGVGMFLYLSADASLLNCVFTANSGAAPSSSSVGGVINVAESQLQMSGCTMAGNTCLGDSVLSFDNSIATVTNCQFSFNTNSISGTVGIFESAVTMNRCAVVKNSSPQMAAFSITESTLNLNNSLVADNLNTAGQSGISGGIIYLADSTVIAVNDTVVNNVCDGGGSAFFLDGSTLDLTNGIVWNNTAPSGVFVSVEQNQVSLDTGYVHPADNIIEGLSLYGGHGNLPYDPLFVDPANGNYELQADSPANSVGGTSGISTNDLDLAGIPRLRGSQVDLGAYAYPGTPGTPVDLATSFSSQALCSGGSAVFSVVDAAGGSMPVTWQVNLGSGFVNVTGDAYDTITTLNGGSGSQLAVSLPDTSLNGAMYRYILGNLSVTSAPAILTVNPRTIVYVDAGATGAGTGATWSDAFTSLSSALQVADSCTAIYVAAGTYPQSSRLELPPGTAIYGGFPGGGAAGARNPTNNPTIITAAGGLSDFLMRIGQTALPGQNNLIDGLQFTNANQAIECDNGTPVIQNCQFLNLPGNAVYLQGVSATLLNCVFHGAINMPSVQGTLSTVFVSGCVFTNDSVSTAGGFRCDALSLTESQTTATNCAVYNYSGSAISAYQGVVTVYASRFSGNTNANGGAAVYNYQATVTLNDCLVDRNSTTSYGGAIYDSQGLTVVNGSTLVNNTGPALVSNDGDDRFYNSIIWANSSDFNFFDGRSHSFGNDIVQNPGLASGSSVFVADPLFNNPAAGDYTLSARSPAIGVGNVNVPVAGEFDFAGNARVQNGAVDLGAYESGLAPNPISLITEPQSITACSTEPAVFQVAGNVPYTFQWQYNIGGGWINVSAGAFIDGATATTNQSSTASTLTLTGLSTNLTGLLVQAVLVGNAYTTAAAGLTVVPAGTIYVDASAPAGGDGSSWSKAFNSLIDGFSATTVCSPTVWVAQGTYLPTFSNIYGKAANDHFVPPAGIAIYGGFPAGGGDWSTRDWKAHPTMLTHAPNTGPARAYVVAIDQANGITLDGFNILGGQGLTGIDIENAGATLCNLIVTNCGHTGLSLYQSPAAVSNCWFLANSCADDGGGAVMNGTPDATFVDCVFQGNVAQAYGGGLYIGNCNPRLVNVLITGNESGADVTDFSTTYGSGGIYAYGGTPCLTNCTVAENTGGIDLQSSGINLVNSIVWGNRYGGRSLESQQVAFESSGGTLDHSTIEGLATYSGTQIAGSDPLFLSPLSASQAPATGGDYHLAACSPFLSSGNLSAVSGLSVDLDGQPRVVGGAVGYGPYESATNAATPLIVTLQPLPLLYQNGGSSNLFTVAASGDGLSYEWQYGSVSLVGVPGFSGANTTTLTVDQPDPAFNGSLIRCQVSSSSGCVTYSTAVLLTVYPSRFYVNAATGSDLNNGLTWSNAFATVGPALSRAYDTNGAAVWIATGSYVTPANASANWQNAYTVPQNMTLYGGFAGTETDPGQRVFGANPAVVQAFGVSARPTNQSSSAVFQLSAGAGLDGLTVANAGTGVYLQTGSGNTMNGCTFSNCYNGIWNEGATSLQLGKCYFQGNQVGFNLTGGGATITNSVFAGDVNGLAVLNGSVTAAGCSFSGEGTGAGAGSGTLIVLGGTFAGNGLGASTGGGVLEVQDSAFTGNAQGLNATFGILELQRDAFRGNGSTNLAAGGAVGLGYGISGRTIIEDCLFSGNVAQLGGAIRDLGYGNTFRNCTLTGNGNLAIYNDRNQDTLVNCLLWNNSPASADNSTDPEFVSPVNAAAAPTTNGDFHLGPCSPYIATGNTGAIGNSTTDLDGQPRLFSGTVTPGAYEPQLLPFQFTLQPASAFGSLGQAVSFTGTVSAPAGVTYQWQASANGGTYTNLPEAAPYSNVATTTLNLAGAAEYNGYAYRLAATSPAGCVVYSQPAVYNYFLVAPGLVDVPADLLRAPFTNITLALPGGVDASSVDNQSIVLYGMESGRATVGFSVNGGVVSLDPENPFHAGEVISVTADSGLKTTIGTSAEPRTWQFFNDVNSWNGVFSSPQTLSISGMTSANTLAIGDLNGDGSLDLLVSTATGGMILTNDGAGNFAASGPLLGTTAAARVVLGDTRALGRLDALLIRNGSLEVWTNDGTGILNLSTNYTGLPVTDIALGDLNNDGYLDLFVVSPNGDQVWTNDGAGHFVDSGIRLADHNGASVALGDFNGDGYLDAVVVGPSAGTVWLNQGGNGFAPGPGGGIYSGYSRVLVGDVNNDGKLDLVVARDGAGDQGFVDVWSGTGFGNFDIIAENWSSGTGHGALAVGDVNGDHFSDIVYLTTGFNLAVNETATVWYPTPAAAGNLGGANATALGDLNGDGALDLAIVNPQGKVAVAFYQPTQLSGDEGTLLTGFGQTFIDAFARISTNTLTTVTIASLPSQGTLYLSGTAVTAGQVVPAGQLSALSYEGAEFYHGRDLFTWQGTDQNGLLSGTLDFNITLFLVPHNVVPADDYLAVGQGGTVSTLTNGVASVFANDLNVDGGTLAGGLNTPPAHGTIQFNPDGTFVYTHDGSPTHADSFSYLVTNVTTGDFAGATAHIAITNVNHTPTAIGLSANTIYEGQPAGLVVGQLSAVDPDPAHTQFIYTLVPGAGANDNAEFAITNNTLVTAGPLDAADGLTRVVRIRVTDEATAYDTGGAYFENYFQINITPLPVALVQNVNAGENATTAIVLAGTSAQSYTVVDAPTNGVLSGTAPNLTYTPNPDYFGPDYFAFQVTDGVMTSSVAPVFITVNFADEAPTVTNQNLSTLENTPVNVTLLAAPFLPSETLAYQITYGPNYGTLSGTAPNYIYTPFTNVHSADTIIYTASDGSLTSQPGYININIQHVNQAPVAISRTYQVQENSVGQVELSAADPDFDAVAYRVTVLPAHGTVSIPGSTSVIGYTQNPEFWTYQPDQNFSGTDSFVFVANDGRLDSNPATITINVTPLPSPVAVAQTVNPTNVQPFGITLSAYDSKGFTNLGMFYSLATYPTNGQITQASSGSSNLTYTPLANFTGRDSFSFTASEGGFVSAPAPVQVTIVAPPPIAYPATYGNFGNSTSIVLQATDPNGLPLTYYIVDGPTNGVINFANFPRVGYAPNLNYWGVDTFTFGVSNSFGGSASNTITFDMVEYAHPPEVVEELLTNVVFAGLPFTLNVSALASDPLGDPLTIIGASSGYGTVTFTSNTVTFYGGSGGGTEGFETIVSNRFETGTALVALTVLPRRILVNEGLGAPDEYFTNETRLVNGESAIQAPDLPSAVAFANSFGPGLEWDIFCGTSPDTTPITLAQAQTNSPDGSPSALVITGNIVITPEPPPVPNAQIQPLQLSIDPSAIPMRLFQVANGGRLRLENCVLSDGTALDGGAIYNEGTLEIVSDTLTNNLALGGTNELGLGGAIYNHNGSIAMTNSTLINNTADLAGGVYQFGDGAAASMVVSNCVITGSDAYYDFYSTNDFGGSSTITSTLLSVEQPSQPWFGPLETAYTVQNSLAVNFPVNYDTFTGGFVINPVNPWGDASALQIKGDGATRMLGLTPSESTAQSPQAITVTLTNGGVSYAEVFTLAVNPSSQSAPIAVNDYAEVVQGHSVTIPVLANDENPDSTPLTITGVSNGQLGNVTIAGTNVIYQCLIGSVQLDSFTYQISNGAGVSTGTVFVQLVESSAESPGITSSADDGGPGTLRAALNFASQFSDNTVWNISLSPGLDNVLTLSSSTNTTCGPAAFIISEDVVIDGGAVPGATIEMDTNSAARLFYITPSGSLTLRNIRLTGGVAVPGTYGAGLGGAIYNAGTLILTNVIVDDNTALGANQSPGLGGGIYNAGTLVMNDTLITNNTASDGGGLYQFADGNAVSVIMTNCSFENPNSKYDLTGLATNNGTAAAMLVNSVIINPAPPWVGELPDEAINGNGQIAFYSSAGTNLTALSATSGNSLVVPTANLSLSSQGTLDLLNLNPVNNGVVGISVAAEAGGVSFARNFNIGVLGAGVVNPVVPDSSASVFIQQSVLVPVLSNAVSVVGAPLSIISVSGAVAGLATITNNEILYTSTGDAPTNEVLTFVVTNDFGGSATATLAIAVTPYQLVNVTQLGDFDGGGLRTEVINEQGGSLTEFFISPSLANQADVFGAYTPDSHGVFSGGENYTALIISGHVIIDGSHAPGFTLSVNNDFSRSPPMRMFHVLAGASLELRNLTLAGGQGIGYGGAILNEGTLRCENVQFLNNTPYGSGAYGAAICNLSGGMALTNCVFAGNSASGSSAFGGAIYNRDGTVVMDSNVLSNNSARNGSAVYNFGNLGTATLELRRNVFAGTSAGPELLGAATAQGHSIISNYHDSIETNGTPSISPIADQVATGAIDVNFATQLPGSAAGYGLTASSSDQSLVPDGNLVVSGSLTNGTLAITSAGTDSGDVQVTLTLANTNLVYAETFDVTISHEPPSVTTHSASGLTPTTATLNGTVNPNGAATAVYFVWGAGTASGHTNLAANLSAGDAPVSVSVTLAGLAPHTAYAFQVLAVSEFGTTPGAQLPFVTTGSPETANVSVSAVTGTSAVLAGSVLPRGAACGAWFAWGATTNYGQTTAVINVGNGWAYVPVGNQITGLTPGTTYHYRLFATNSVGTTNSADYSFTTIGPPAVTTHSATSVTSTSATLNATVNPNGLATAVYFIWGPGSAGGNTNLAANLAAGTAAVSVSDGLTGLAPHTAYSFQVMAVNAAGTNFGAQVSLTTPGAPEVTGVSASAVTANSAMLNGSVTARGAACGAWFAWGTTTSYGQTTAVTSIGNGWAYVPVGNQITGLSPGTTYHYRLFATNSVGVTNSADYTFTTPAAPSVVTHSATTVAATTATLNGMVNPNGAATAVYFIWGPVGAVGNTNLAASLLAGTASVGVSNVLTGLAPHTAYAFQAMAVNAVGTNFGALLTLTTPGSPEVADVFVSDVTTNSVVLNGLVTARGAACGAWFALGTTTNYGQTTAVTNIGAGWPYVAVSNALTGLIPGTTYHFQMLATNSAGATNSADIVFTLPPGAPVAVTHSASGVTSTAATLNGTVNPVGLATAVYFVWGPGSATGNTNLAVNLPAGTATVGVSNLLTGLSPHTAYYFKVMAVNVLGTNFGAAFAFTTPDAPEVKSVAALDVTSTSAVLSGLATARGASAGAWFVWGATTNYGQITAVTNIGAGWSYAGVSNLVTGLNPGTKYHFRMFATNIYGSTNSADYTFTTPASPSEVVHGDDGKSAITSVQLVDLITLADGTKRIYLAATPGQTYVVEAADDPAATGWSDISTNTADATGEFSFIDPASAGAPSRFYRLRSP